MNQIVIQKISITDLSTDAVVNAANEGLWAGFAMHARYIIHAVGPVWYGGTQGEPEKLYGAYRSALELAEENGCHSIGFPLISAGIYGYPVSDAWEVAVKACRDFHWDRPEADMQIVFAVLDDRILRIGESVLKMRNA